jgi:hypothetical protein
VVDLGVTVAKKLFKIATSILLLVGMLTLDKPAWAADLVGDWAGGTIKTGSAAGAGGHIYFYGSYAYNALGSPYTTVVLQPYVAEAVFTTDSMQVLRTGTYTIADWLGKTGVLEFFITDTSIQLGTKQSQIYTVKFQVRDTPPGSGGDADTIWYDASSVSVTDSCTSAHSVMVRDTVDFASLPLARGVFGRVQVAGAAGNLIKGKKGQLYLDLKLERTGTP